MKIALVTFEFEGITKSGGIGTAYRRMAELLASQGHHVTAVVVPFGWDDSFALRKKKSAKETAFLKRKGVNLAIVGIENFPELLHAPYHLRRSLAVYHYLKKKNFAVIHYSDNCGLTYFSLLAKRSKLEFHESEFVVGTHGSPLWTNEANRTFQSESVLLDQIDRYCVEYADHLVSPSAYMLSHLRKKGWKLPKDSLVIPNVNDLLMKSPPRSSRAISRPISPRDRTKSLVFFGRLELRKGILLFVGAVEKLLDQDPTIGLLTPLEIIFLGRPEPDDNGVTHFIYQRLNRFGSRLSLKFVPGLRAAQSIEFLSMDSRRLVCMPSLLENSPYVIIESTELDLDFISTDSGGQRELLYPADRKKVLVLPRTEDLYQAIRKRLRSGAIRVRASQRVVDANRMWIGFHKRLKKEKKPPKPFRALSRRPSVSIVLESQGPLEILKKFNALLKQDIPSLEVLIPVGIGCGKSPSSRLKVKYYDPSASSSRWLSAAKSATGKYLLFMGKGELISKSTLRDWVIAADAWLERDRACLSVSGIIAHLGSFVLTHPADSLLCVTGQSPGNIFALWNRTLFLKQATSHGVNLSSERALAPFFSSALTRGLSFGSVPMPVVRTSHYEQKHEMDWDQLSKIEPFMNTAPKDWSRWVCYLVARERDLELLRVENFDLRTKLDLLSQSFQNEYSSRKKAGHFR